MRSRHALPTLSSEERLRRATFLTVLMTHSVCRRFPLTPQRMQASLTLGYSVFSIQYSVIVVCGNGVSGVPQQPEAKVKDNGFPWPPPGWEFYGKRSFSVTTPCASPTRVDTERLAERETLLHRLGSKLNRTVFNSCKLIIRSANT